MLFYYTFILYKTQQRPNSYLKLANIILKSVK